ncbi:hypothetical protein Mapa_011253 [Marchantia paleacea]|nr:hypothetical protein Mapa_011253 [Marchantia paleacea]
MQNNQMQQELYPPPSPRLYIPSPAAPRLAPPPLAPLPVATYPQTAQCNQETDAGADYTCEHCRGSSRCRTGRNSRSVKRGGPRRGWSAFELLLLSLLPLQLLQCQNRAQAGTDAGASAPGRQRRRKPVGPAAGWAGGRTAGSGLS